MTTGNEDITEALGEAFDLLDQHEKQAPERRSMAYEEQCLRDLLRIAGGGHWLSRDLRSAVRDSEAPWRFRTLEELVSLPVIPVVGDSSRKSGLRLSQAFSRGSGSRLVKSCLELLGSCVDDPRPAAVFCRAVDAGNVVVHPMRIVDYGPCLYIPVNAGPVGGDCLFCQSRANFCRYLIDVALC